MGGMKKLKMYTPSDTYIIALEEQQSHHTYSRRKGKTKSKKLKMNEVITKNSKLSKDAYNLIQESQKVP